ncbi:MAG: isoprenylcysteine carboxylmethyltransferase family protein [Bacteroidales bacterium]|nr:isoprenylcysteine carboxylmethyltransferase family protein [Bacteroidales bacterium]
MEKYLFFICLALCVLAHIIRTIYEIKKVNKEFKPGKLGFFLILLNMFVLWASWFNMCEVDIYKINLPDLLRYFGLSVFIAGLCIFFIALFTIKALENYEGELIQKGIYSKIRHPMYLGFILWIIGYSVFQNAMVTLLISIIFIGNVLYWRHLEEKILIKKYSGYKEYINKTYF